MESTQPWHSPNAVRRHRIEIDSCVLNGRFVAAWRFSRNLHRPETINRLTQEFVAALREIIQHCLGVGVGGFTPADFPQVQIDQAALDRLAAGPGKIADIFPLSPMQSLFFSARRRPSPMQAMISGAAK